ncbi:MAG: SPOR domain-containing protein, partial [Rhodospirillaceae bacterium]
MYFNEQGLIRNDIEIVKWVSLAAGQGFVPAILRLAEMYEKGIAFTQSDREALHWYRLAAERGDRQAAAAVTRLQQDAVGDTRETPPSFTTHTGDAAVGEPEAPPMPRPLVTVPPLPVSASPSAPADAAPAESDIPPEPAAARTPGRPTAIAEPPAQARSPVSEMLPASQPDSESGPSASPAPQAALPERSANTAKPEEWRVQFASFRNISDAFNAWQSLKNAAGDTLAGVEPIVVPADLGERGVYHRLQAGPLASGNAARALCARVQSAATRQDCLVVRVPAQ